MQVQRVRMLHSSITAQLATTTQLATTAERDALPRTCHSRKSSSDSELKSL